MATVYDLYWNAGQPGAPIDYSTPFMIGVTSPWTSFALARSTTYKFGIRARDSVTGLIDANVDAVITVTTDANGNDTAGAPMPPQHITVTPVAAGGIRVEWTWPYQLTQTTTTPTGFHVYLGTGAGPDWSSPVATQSYRSGQRFFSITVPGLIGGQQYWVGVRAFNAAGEETNVAQIAATPISAAPKSISNLIIIGTSTAA